MNSRTILGLMLRAVVLALVASVLVVVPPSPPPASAAGPASVTLEGRGYGHGRGMSQHGAQEAASEHGRTYRQILAFYYPGLEMAAATGKIRVWISRDLNGDVEVQDRRRLRVRQVGTGTSWALDTDGAERWRLTPADGGSATRVSVLTNGWHAVRTIAGEAEITAGGRPIGLFTADGPVRYQGALRSAATGSGRVTVNVLRLDSYLRGVVPLEVPALWHPQAVQAQAVAARTYADYHRDHPSKPFYDLCDTTSCQVYGGVAAAHPASDQAIRATTREVLLHDGAPAFTEFSSSNGGWTVAGSQPYLVAQQDPWDPVNPWRETLTDNEIEAAFPAVGDFQRLRVRRRDGNGAWGGRVLRIRVVGSRSAVTMSGGDFREQLIYDGVKSTWFRQA